MKKSNCIISLKLTELARARETMQVCQACNARVKVLGVPSDYTAVAVVVYNPNGDRYTAQPLSVDGNGDWGGKIAGAFFPATGTAKYELIAADEDGETISLGWGSVIIAPFKSGSEQPAGEFVRLTAIPDDSGQMHDIVAVQNEYGEWTWEIRN